MSLPTLLASRTSVSVRPSLTPLLVGAAEVVATAAEAAVAVADRHLGRTPAAADLGPVVLGRMPVAAGPVPRRAPVGPGRTAVVDRDPRRAPVDPGRTAVVDRDPRRAPVDPGRMVAVGPVPRRVLVVPARTAVRRDRERGSPVVRAVP